MSTLRKFAHADREDGMVRDIDDLDLGNDEFRDPTNSRGKEDYPPDHKDDDDGRPDALYKDIRDRSYERNEFNSPEDMDDFDADAGWEFMNKFNTDNEEPDLEDMGGDDKKGEDGDMGGAPIGGNLNTPTDGSSDEDGEENEEGEPEKKEPSKYEGVVRSVKGAYLVSKKQQPDETYTEIWMYNVGGKFQHESDVRKGVLSGTDIIIGQFKNRNDYARFLREWSEEYLDEIENIIID